MARDKGKILSKKCTEMKSIHKKKYKTKHRSSRIFSKGNTGRRKNRRNQMRTPFLRKQPIARSDSKSVVYLTTRKRFREDSPKNGESASEKDECVYYLRTSRASPNAGKKPKNGILNRSISATDIIEHYLNPALNRVPSSVEELETCFGRERDVFAPEKSRGNAYGIAELKSLEERKRSKKIRFEIPEGTLGYEDAKKAMWRTRKNESANVRGNHGHHKPLKTVPTRHPTAFLTNPHENRTKSTRPKIPVVERLKREEDTDESELDLKAIIRYLKKQSGKVREAKKRSRSRHKKRKKTEKVYSGEDATAKKESGDDCEYEFKR